MSLQQCHPNLAGSRVIARRMGWNVVLLFLCVVGYPPNWGKRPRYIDRLSKIVVILMAFWCAFHLSSLCISP